MGIRILPKNINNRSIIEISPGNLASARTLKVNKDKTKVVI
jgi:hypothetical protein